MISLAILSMINLAAFLGVAAYAWTQGWIERERIRRHGA
jgi:hypothetical protein